MWGLLVGAGLGVGSTLLLDARVRSRVRGALREGAGVLADRLAALGDDSVPPGDRRAARAGRTLQKRVDRMRAAGL